MRTLARGRFLELLVNDRGWEFVRRVRGSIPVGIVAVTDEGMLLLISQHRPPVAGVVIEIPAGLVGDQNPDESWQEAARRELLEETGYSAERVEELTLGPTSAGLTSEIIRLVWARDVRKVGVPHGDPTERITVYEVPLGSADAWLAEQHRRGALVDPKVYAALWFAIRQEKKVDGG